VAGLANDQAPVRFVDDPGVASDDQARGSGRNWNAPWRVKLSTFAEMMKLLGSLLRVITIDINPIISGTLILNNVASSP
jgi:hypothetical protein